MRFEMFLEIHGHFPCYIVHDALAEGANAFVKRTFGHVNLAFDGLINFEQGNAFWVLFQGETACWTPMRIQVIIFDKTLENFGYMVA